jgi:superfamily II DNA or RNA helicase
MLIGMRTGIASPTTSRKIGADETASAASRDVAYLLGETDDPRVKLLAAGVEDVLDALIESGHARWHAGGAKLIKGETRLFASASAPTLPPRSGVIVAGSGPWYVDAATGQVGRIRIAKPAAVQAPRTPASSAPPASARLPAAGLPPARFPPAHTASRLTHRPAAAPPPPPTRRGPAAGTEPVIVDRTPLPLLRLTKLAMPDDRGRMQQTDALLLDFDYDGGIVPFDDDRQFVKGTDAVGPIFIRRDKTAETAALEAIRQDGLVQMRLATGKSERGRMVFMFRGPDAAVSWQAFASERLPTLQALGWRTDVDKAFGPKTVQSVGTVDMRVTDAAQGAFSLDFGIEIDGIRHPLLPILMRLHERGGMANARIVDGQVIAGLDDGRILKLPADRIGRMLAVVEDMIEVASRNTGDTMVVDGANAASVLDLEDVLTTRWQDGSAIAAMAARFRAVTELPETPIPVKFAAELRPYQQQGVNWLQHLRANDLGGLLADDMGLGKTAQTIAHICVEEANDRLDLPVLIVVPTSLVPNWQAELRRFAPHLRVAVLHGLDRHERRRELADVQVVITTYTVLARDIEDMAGLTWHIVVLDEAQAIKNSSSKATLAVCRLDARHRICLSGTPIENNLGELWSQFAFLMPGLLGSRKSFNKRFRTPIEKEGDKVRQRMLGSRIKPFILRRTKSAVATELPPKHTILRRIVLAPEQREIYDTVQAAMRTEITEGIAERGMAQSRFLVLSALLKLRQICCDPRLAKTDGPSAKLDDLLEMVSEMIEEGRRILLFSQFTSMLDLIKPALAEAGIPFTELRGDTADRAEPVRCFESGEVPLFLISLKAGGRGLNLTSADTVIHYDPWWNPAVEDQASDRAHRIGQTKSVFVYKLIAAGTVEERIVELQERKAALATLALSEDGMALPAMDESDIDYLFGAGDTLLAAA